MRLPTFPRSGVLVLGDTSVQALVPSTVISQVESLLDSHKIEDAVGLVDQRRKKLEGNISVDEDEADELRYVYQRIGFQCFSETLFEDAGKNLYNGELDPRLLISYYPDLRGSLFSAEDTMDVFAGVAERMPTEASVEDIIAHNLVRNYSPHLSPNTRSAPPTAELRKILVMAAEEMLEVFLRKWRSKWKMGDSRPAGNTIHSLDAIVDTVLVKLFARFEKTKDLYALLQDGNNVVLSEVETILRDSGQYNGLCILYQQRGEDAKLLEVWSRLVEGQWDDEDIKDPLSNMISLLTERRNKALTQQWGLWLTKRNPEQGLKLLMPRDSGKRREKPEEDIALLQQIEEANPTAGELYLDYLVLQRRSTSRELHTRLALSCVNQMLKFLEDEAVSKLWRAKVSSYNNNRNNSSFLSYFAATTPDSDHKRVRLKTILILAGSSLYDVEAIRQRISTHDTILTLESAILDGKLGKHRSALSILVRSLHDATSAEAYCTLGGEVIPGKIAQSIGSNYGLEQCATTFYPSPTSKGDKGGPQITSQKTVNEELKKDLLKILLEVYMEDEELSSQRAAHLLNSQAVNLDVIDVVSLVPPKWPLNAMSSFLARSFRRTLHARQEGKIVKNIAAGQNLEVKDQVWDILREEGAIIEEAVQSDDDGEPYDEKVALAEKVALHLTATDIPREVGKG